MRTGIFPPWYYQGPSKIDCFSQSLSSDSFGVKKSALMRIVCACMNRHLPWSGSRAQNYIVRHSNILHSFVLSSHMIGQTIEISDCYDAPWEISVHTIKRNDYQASRFFTPQLLIDKLWFKCAILMKICICFYYHKQLISPPCTFCVIYLICTVAFAPK